MNFAINGADKLLECEDLKNIVLTIDHLAGELVREGRELREFTPNGLNRMINRLCNLLKFKELKNIASAVDRVAEERRQRSDPKLESLKPGDIVSQINGLGNLLEYKGSNNIELAVDRIAGELCREGRELEKFELNGLSSMINRLSNLMKYEKLKNIAPAVDQLVEALQQRSYPKLASLKPGDIVSQINGLGNLLMKYKGSKKVAALAVDSLAGELCREGRELGKFKLHDLNSMINRLSNLLKYDELKNIEPAVKRLDEAQQRWLKCNMKSLKPHTIVVTIATIKRLGNLQECQDSKNNIAHTIGLLVEELQKRSNRNPEKSELHDMNSNSLINRREAISVTNGLSHNMVGMPESDSVPGDYSPPEKQRRLDSTLCTGVTHQN